MSKILKVLIVSSIFTFFFACSNQSDAVLKSSNEQTNLTTTSSLPLNQSFETEKTSNFNKQSEQEQ